MLNLAIASQIEEISQRMLYAAEMNAHVSSVQLITGDGDAQIARATGKTILIGSPEERPSGLMIQGIIAVPGDWVIERALQDDFSDQFNATIIAMVADHEKTTG